MSIKKDRIDIANVKNTDHA